MRGGTKQLGAINRALRRLKGQPGTKVSVLVRLGFKTRTINPVVEYIRETPEVAGVEARDSMSAVGHTFDWGICTIFDQRGNRVRVMKRGEGHDKHEPADWEREDYE